MAFQWLQMRITEEQDRIDRERHVLKRLPQALDEMHQALAECLASYTGAFGAESAEIRMDAPRITVTVRERRDGAWRPRGTVNLTAMPLLPGFLVERPGAEPLEVEIGILPGDKIYFKDKEKFLTVEELTRRVLDRVLFPKLVE